MKQKDRPAMKDAKAQSDLIEMSVRDMLIALGLDINDLNLLDTPRRVSKMYLEAFDGLVSVDSVKDILSITFPSKYEGIIVHDNMIVFSFCPHHLLPVEYNVSLAYISDKTVGLSKIPRAVELLAKRPILQETYTHEITEALVNHLDAKAALVIVKGKHSCMRIRGVRTLSDTVVTSDVKGIFKTDSAARAEAIQLLALK